jgi:hypothetical protein
MKDDDFLNYICTMKFVSAIHYLLFVALAIATSVACRDYTPPSKSTLAVRNADIATIRNACQVAPITFDNDAVIAGRVTTTDRAGNFQRSLFVEDTTGGAEIMVGMYDLHCKYPLGTMLSIKLRGTTAYVTDGVLQIGLKAESYSYHEVDYFYSEAVADRHIGRGTDIVAIEPMVCRISTLDSSCCGRLVAIDALQHSPLDERDGITTIGFHRFTDADGDEVYMHISERADFATEQLPNGLTHIIGILHYGDVGYGVGDKYYIKPRTKDDILVEYNPD